MFVYSPTRICEAGVAMDVRDMWSGSPALCSGPLLEPSWEFGRTAGWSDGVTSGHLLGEIDLAATPAAVRLARSYVRELIGEYFSADRSALGDLELLTSEAVTNSVVHAKPLRDGTVMLSALHIDHFVQVNVTDGGSRRGDTQASNDPFAANGRGLRLIKALATDYGTRRNADGTATFWFGTAIGEGWKVP
jgi:anti-sigma regulatory factor (Ser/Thr protein kinase)